MRTQALMCAILGFATIYFLAGLGDRTAPAPAHHHERRNATLRIFLAVLSHPAHTDLRQAARRTWMRRLAALHPGVRVRFFTDVIAHAWEARLGDTVAIQYPRGVRRRSCGAHCRGSLMPVLGMLVQALQHPWDVLVRLDDDVFVCPENLVPRMTAEASAARGRHALRLFGGWWYTWGHTWFVDEHALIMGRRTVRALVQAYEQGLPRHAYLNFDQQASYWVLASRFVTADSIFCNPFDSGFKHLGADGVPPHAVCRRYVFFHQVKNASDFDTIDARGALPRDSVRAAAADRCWFLREGRGARMRFKANAPALYTLPPAAIFRRGNCSDAQVALARAAARQVWAAALAATHASPAPLVPLFAVDNVSLSH
jgi:hypothetical protein